jgi:RHS repeat-associated protein
VLRVANRSLRVDGTASRHTSAGVKTASYAYDPYGRTRTATGPNAATNAFRYAGGLYDSTTGATKFGARYYDPNVGRFTQPDPSRQEQNAYAYTGGNPINFRDPTGLSTATDVINTTVSTALLVGAFVGLLLIAPETAPLVIGLTVGGFEGSVVTEGLAIGCDLSENC